MVRPFFTPQPREAASIEREEFYLELILQINSFINGIVWGPIMLFLLVGTGVYLTVRCGCLQARKFGFMLRSTLGSLFRKTDKSSGGQNLTPFQAVSTALAGTVGTGNIAGVTGAIFAGGPGAVFWMWVSAFFGMMTKYAEIVLAVKYRQVDADGTHFGGPMYYIEKGTGHKWLAVLFALLGGVACFGIGNIAQSTEIAGAMQSLVGLPPLCTGILLAILTAFVVIGGVKRIGQVASYLVPFMAIFYIVAGVAVILLRITDVPAVLASIFTEAFSFRAVGGGVFGYAILVAMRQGFARGVFSNEAGLGSAPMAHAASNTKEPVEQGLWGIFEVFVDTIIICTLTSMAVLLSGVLEYDISSLRLQRRGGGRSLQRHPPRHHRRHGAPDQPAVLRPVHHPGLELLRGAVLGLPHPQQQDCQPDLQGGLRAGVRGGRRGLGQPDVGHLRHPQRHDGHSQPDRPAAALGHGGPADPHLL